MRLYVTRNRLAGHASPNTTVGYVAFSSQDAHEAVGAITHRAADD